MLSMYSSPVSGRVLGRAPGPSLGTSRSVIGYFLIVTCSGRLSHGCRGDNRPTGTGPRFLATCADQAIDKMSGRIAGARVGELGPGRFSMEHKGSEVEPTAPATGNPVHEQEQG